MKADPSAQQRLLWVLVQEFVANGMPLHIDTQRAHWPSSERIVIAADSNQIDERRIVDGTANLARSSSRRARRRRVAEPR